MAEDSKVGEVIREIRHFMGWSQADVGRWCGISTNMIAQIEGGRIPNANAVRKLAIGMRVPAERLLGIQAAK